MEKNLFVLNKPKQGNKKTFTDGKCKIGYKTNNSLWTNQYITTKKVIQSDKYIEIVSYCIVCGSWDGFNN